MRLLFTAFETSGDVLAARLLEAIRRREPDVEAFALGGPKLEAAGATLLEETTGHAQMGLGAVAQVAELRRRVKFVRDWLADHPINALIPVDSPAANWHFCKTVRKQSSASAGEASRSARIVHLVAPQVWAWATWRVNWLKRLSDHVLCLLPFEPGYFAEHGISATFVGHPLFAPDTLEKKPKPEGLSQLPGVAADASPRLALLPGSRPGEVEKNWADMLGAFDQLRFRFPKLVAAVAASDRTRANQITRQCPGGRLPRRVGMVVGEAAAALDWADAAVVVSGTATLEAVSRGCPHVALYRASPVLWNTVGRAIIRARTFTLPNLLGEHLGLASTADSGRVVPELVPHFGGHEPVLRAIEPLLQNADRRDAQRADFRAIADAFAGVNFQQAACDALFDVLGR
ncbi:MAG: hypothetical protein AAGE65_03660 [Planctomycetota bacterium]